MKNIILFSTMSLFFIVTMAPRVLAQGKGKKTETVTIHTSAVCEECKGFIESALKKTPGVRKAVVDLKSGNATVEFFPEKVSVAALRTAISNSGYQADDVAPNEEAFDNLPKCCKHPSEHK